ncbi:MAG: RsmB/NOP family class I SAM-dependent RNA methyltransferase [Promethearchaeota archaeon]
MIKRYIDFLGEHETLKLLEANETPLTPSIRVNTLKITPEQLKTRLEKKGFQLKRVEWILHAFKVKKEPFNLGSTHEYLKGYYYIQNVTSMLPSLILNPRSNHLVIDMAAAPGGKGTHLAQLMNNQGTLILIDRNRKRILSLEMNIRRLGVTNAIVLHQDSTLLSKLNVMADKILLDAPCTGEGLIKIDKTRKKSKKMSHLKKMSTIQKTLLKEGLSYLKKGGHLIYSTCSIAPEENELVINEILKNQPNFKIEKISKQYGVEGLTSVYGETLLPALKHAQRFYPHIHDTIGFFICLIRRTS